jgi:hypothetical protein
MDEALILSGGGIRPDETAATGASTVPMPGSMSCLEPWLPALFKRFERNNKRSTGERGRALFL